MYQRTFTILTKSICCSLYVERCFKTGKLSIGDRESTKNVIKNAERRFLSVTDFVKNQDV